MEDFWPPFFLSDFGGVNACRRSLDCSMTLFFPSAFRTTRLQPPGGHVHISSELVPESVMTKSANRYVSGKLLSYSVFESFEDNAARE